MAIPLEFTIDGSPVSQQARRRQRVREWQQEVRNVAEREWKGEPPVAEELMVTIIYVYDAIPLDVDNIPKPILDALKGLVFINDNQITDLICRKRDMSTELQVQYFSPALDEALDGSTPFVHIIVGNAPDQEMIPL